MRKFIAMMAIAALFAACGNSADTTEEDAAKKKADSIHVADSIKAAQDAAMQMERDKMMKDSIDKAKKDSMDKLQKK